jgi:hypothetical protein
MILNPVAKSTTVILTQPSVGSSLSVVQIEMSLDNPTDPGVTSANMTWALLSSGTAMLSSISLSLVYSVLSPVAAVRLNSSAIVASSGTFTLKALQSVTA